MVTAQGYESGEIKLVHPVKKSQEQGGEAEIKIKTCCHHYRHPSLRQGMTARPLISKSPLLLWADGHKN